ncbi:MAG: Ni/Fe hydrogenase subunit alpha [Opitutae bacterium]|nr:Ni/Fe hydrogenase subunit alpha [Opitutae bacterium]
MTRRILIDPVTRIEGHAKISLRLDEDGHVADAEFHVTEFRGFEKFCEGRTLAEMPGITARICGICPVSHLLASAKAGDAILAVRVPTAADKLRRLMNLGQIVQSHALSFFHLSSPDFLLGWDTPPAQRNVFGLAAQKPELARAGIRLRQFGQEIIELLGGKKIHPGWAVPGGVRSGVDRATLDKIKAWLPEAFATTNLGIGLFKHVLETHGREIETYGDFPSMFMGLVGPRGEWEHHGGKLRFTDSAGQIVQDQIDPKTYASLIAEQVQTSSYLKSPYYRALGPQAGLYRVGPLARLNVCTTIGTPKADAELANFRSFGRGGAVTSSFLYHYARLIEILAALERIALYCDDEDLLRDHIRSDAGINHLHGVGVSEAPRGTLIHDYTVDENGLLTKVNLIIATGHNNLAMNRTVAQIARAWIKPGSTEIPEPLLNRVEHGIRCYDPCLSCSTHAVGKMPLLVQLVSPTGAILNTVARD